MLMMSMLSRWPVGKLLPLKKINPDQGLMGDGRRFLKEKMV